MGRLKPRTLTVIASVLMVIGTPSLVWGLVTGNPLNLVAGGILTALGLAADALSIRRKAQPS